MSRDDAELLEERASTPLGPGAPIPEPGRFFHTKKGKPVACPAAPVPIADSHTHLTCLVDLDPAVALARDALAGVDFVLTVVDPTDDAANPRALMARLDIWQRRARATLDAWGRTDLAVPRVRLAVGCHPHNARLFDRAAHEAMAYLLGQPVCSALGEIGLDYHYDFSPRQVQREVFAEQLRLACQLDAPLSLHVREAHAEAADIMREVGLPAAGAVMHCFDCGPETLRVFAGLGCHFGIGGAATFSSMGQLRDALADPACAPGCLVTETDSPYMAPTPLRGTACEPADVALSCDYLARLRARAALGLTDQEEAGLEGERRAAFETACLAERKSYHEQCLALFDAKAGFVVPGSFCGAGQPSCTAAGEGAQEGTGVQAGAGQAGEAV